MLNDVGRDQIRSEIEQIEDLFVRFGPLLSKSETGEPDIVELSALGSVLHSFYTGLEGIFLTMVKRVDADVPAGDRWHMDLLDRVTMRTDRRGGVVSESTKQELEAYLAFRHFFRHAYTYILEWNEMQDLVEGLREIWAMVKKEIETFLETEGKEPDQTTR